jgi:16S rRNA processing protein RimM
MSGDKVPSPPADVIGLGVFGRPHGVRGEIVFHPHNPAGARLEDLPFPFEARLGDDPRGGAPPRKHPASVRLLAARSFGDASLARLDGISDRDVAAGYTNLEVLVPRAVLPPLLPGEYYIVDLVGCAVSDDAGRSRGQVVGVYWNGHQDILEIRDDAGEELLIPALPEFLKEVDLGARRLVVDDHE